MSEHVQVQVQGQGSEQVQGQARSDESALVFLIGPSAFEISVSCVRGVIEYGQLAPIPLAPSAMLGAVAAQGEAWAVLDGRYLVGTARIDECLLPGAMILLLNTAEDARLAMAVDQIEGVFAPGMPLRASAVSLKPDALLSKASALAEGA